MKDSVDTTDHCSTIEAARLLGLAVRSVQLMVDRGELDAWKTPGGHRRISRASVDRWLAQRRPAATDTSPAKPAATQDARRHPLVLVVEDSVHYQNLVTLLLRKHFPELELHAASDGITGLTMVGQLQPDLLIVDILLPGIDGAAMISTLRTLPRFSDSKLIVLTSLDEDQREPYAFALDGIPVVHKPDLVAALPPLIAAQLAAFKPGVKA